ncbi:MAG: protein tyrosine phosphatase family protein [Pseudomonadales bacterium]|nr:protein tyrosine phosphatase family protein [Pseudomonadales bacterium]
MSSKMKIVLGLFDFGYFNSTSTLKTSLGFIQTLFGIGSKNTSLDSIFNVHAISENLMTSGQPTVEQFSTINDAGFEHIINLAPHNAENAIKNEADLLKNLGLSYTHIPVDFKNPTEADFSRFCGALNPDRKTWVHCAANMRVSAFIYKYRIQQLGMKKDEARQDLEKLWKPFGVWAEFIDYNN